MSPRKPRRSTALPQRQRGAAIVLIVIALVSILLMSALALDGGHMLVNKTRLQSAVDAAALSGAKTLSEYVGGDMSAGASAAQAAVTLTLDLNAAASGNAELAGVSDLALVTFSESVYGPFATSASSDARYVRVAVPDFPLAGFFWGVLQMFGNPAEKAVAAIATAGPSPTSPCELAPVMVCGEPGQPNFGFDFGALQVLKSASHKDANIGPGNFQLLDFGSGGKTVGDLMAGGGTICPQIGENVQTKPGNTVGPSVKGLNTRFGDYSGSYDADDYPPDLVTDHGQEGGTGNSGSFSLADDGSTILFGNSNSGGGGGGGSGGGRGGGNGGGQGGGGGGGSSVPAVADSDGNITAGGQALFDYNDWLDAANSCASGGGGCEDDGVAGRRILRVVIGGPCTGTDSGTSQVPVLGFGCFFVLQPADQKGNESQIFGQFVEMCSSDGVPGPTPADENGPQIIQLYKTYIDGIAVPSIDS